MLTLSNFARPSESQEIDDLFDLLASKKRLVHQYAWRYKKAVKFYSIHQASHGGNRIECAISGPETNDLRFSITRDKKGYLIEMSVGIPNDRNLKTIIKALSGLAGRLVEREVSGFDTSKWQGYYLWVMRPTAEVMPTFQEAIDLGLMSDEFVKLCLDWGVSIKKYPKS